MTYKLVRVDAVEPYKVLLPLGSHSVGRGKFLDCNDKRVSRNHAELMVTSDSILLKSLHQNPCFIKKNSSTEITAISQPDTQVLCNGDQFGLTPDSFWYEVIQCTGDLSVEPMLSNSAVNVKGNENLVEQNNEINGETQSYNHDNFENKFTSSDKLLDAVVNTSICFSQENEDLPAKESESRSDKPFIAMEDMDTTSIEQPAESSSKQLAESINDNVDSTNQPHDSTNQPIGSTIQPTESTNLLIGSANQLADSTSSLTECSNAVTPTKRQHSEDASCDVKRVKTEPDSPSKDDTKTSTDAVPNQPVKTEPESAEAKAGPSNENGGPSTDSGAGDNPPTTATSPVKPPGRPLRERCMYGANCYRKNPQHKAQFSHPSDSDWGSGPVAQCPWGAGCRRADPRHWRDHDHPPGVLPPPPRLQHNRPGMRVVRRHGNIFYINANAVHFHDDHFDVEDSDGDSVDYDYEF